MKHAFLLAVSLAVVTYVVSVRAEEHKVHVEHSQPLPRGDMRSAPSGIRRANWRRKQPKIGRRSNWDRARPRSRHSRETRTAGSPGLASFETSRKTSRRSRLRLLVEMKYFDGMTDLHLQVVSLSGAGDFRAVIPGVGHKLKNLALVRVYGKVTGEAEGVPLVSATHLRSWDWGLFAFMPYGEDKSNPQWVKLRKVKADDMNVYSSSPDQQYYEDRLGKRTSETPPNGKALSGN